MNFHKGDYIVHKDHSRLKAEVLFAFNDAFTEQPKVDVRWTDSKITQRNLALPASDFLLDQSINF